MPAISFTRWTTQAFYVSVLDTYRGIYNIDRAFKALDYGATPDESDQLLLLALRIPFAIGVAFRLFALFLLFAMHRQQRK